MSAAPRLVTEQSDRVLTVIFNNPPRHFFDEPMSIELDRLTRELRRDSTIRAVVFTGGDDSYLTHFDVPSLLRGAESVPVSVGYGPARAVIAGARVAVANRGVDAVLRRTALRNTLFLARTYRSLERLSRLDQVVLTEINGLALGMGAIFALACDIRIMADDTKIGLVESGIGLLAGAGGTQRLARIVGAAASVQLLLDGSWLTAGDAARLGIVHQVCPRETLRACTLEVADRMAARPSAVTREIKRAVYDSSTRPGVASMRREAAGLVRTLTDRDTKRSMAAYRDYLAANAPLTDEVILRGWERVGISRHTISSSSPSAR